MGYNSLEIPAHLNRPSLSQLLFQCQIIHVTGSKHKEITEGKFKPAGWHPNSYASSALSGVEIIKKHNAVTNTGVAVQPRTIITVWPRLSQLWKHSHSEITGHVTLLKLSIYLHTCLPPVSAYGILLRSKHLHLIMFVPESIYCPLFGITLFILADLKQDFVVYFLHTLLLTFLILIDSTHLRSLVHTNEVRWRFVTWPGPRG